MSQDSPLSRLVGTIKNHKVLRGGHLVQILFCREDLLIPL